MNDVTIGGLAKAAGVSVETVRYYQRRGLMREPHRDYGSVRRYDSAAAARLCFIRSAQRLGFSLKEVEELLRLDRGGSCHAVETLAEQRLEDVRGRIADLKRVECALATLVQRCKVPSGQVRCPLIQSLHSS